MSQWARLLELYYIVFARLGSESDTQKQKVIQITTLTLGFITFVCHLVSLGFVILQAKNIIDITEAAANLSQPASVHFKYYKQTFFISKTILFESFPELI